MKTATVHLNSASPYSQSRKHNTPKIEGESHDAYDERTWPQKMHYTADGEVFIPGMAFKFALDTAAQKLGIKIPGSGNSKWGGVFTSGVLCPDPIMLGINKDDVPFHTLSMNADGRRGSGKRVDRRFPVFQSWQGVASFYILDDRIDERVFRQHLAAAGKIVGVGQFRPQVGGYFGRFSIETLKWDDEAREVFA